MTDKKELREKIAEIVADIVDEQIRIRTTTDKRFTYASDWADKILALLPQEQEKTCKWTKEDVRWHKFTFTECGSRIYSPPKNFKSCPFCTGRIIHD